jgi:hypothetical protein
MMMMMMVEKELSYYYSSSLRQNHVFHSIYVSIICKYSVSFVRSLAQLFSAHNDAQNWICNATDYILLHLSCAHKMKQWEKKSMANKPRKNSISMGLKYTMCACGSIKFEASSIKWVAHSRSIMRSVSVTVSLVLIFFSTVHCGAIVIENRLISLRIIIKHIIVKLLLNWCQCESNRFYTLDEA